MFPVYRDRSDVTLPSFSLVVRLASNARASANTSCLVGFFRSSNFFCSSQSVVIAINRIVNISSIVILRMSASLAIASSFAYHTLNDSPTGCFSPKNRQRRANSGSISRKISLSSLMHCITPVVSSMRCFNRTTRSGSRVALRKFCCVAMSPTSTLLAVK